MKPKAAKRGAARLLRRGVAGILALAGVGMAAVAAGLPPLPEQAAAYLLEQQTQADAPGGQALSFWQRILLADSALLAQAAAGYADSGTAEETTPPEEIGETPNLSPITPDKVEERTLSGSGTEYVNAQGISLFNRTEKTVDLAAIAQAGSSLHFQPAEAGPQILILHTHSTEAYAQDSAAPYQEIGTARTTDPSYNIIKVGEEITRIFEEMGLSVIHDTNLYDYPGYNGAYERSKAAAAQYLAQYPTLQMVLDVHRDALVGADVTVYKPVLQIDGVKTAQVMLLVGSDDAGAVFPDWTEHMALAMELQQQMNSLWPGLARPITLRTARFNQQMTKGSLLVEVGSHGNTLDEALAGARRSMKRERKSLVSSRWGSTKICWGEPSSQITPSRMKTTWLETSLAKAISWVTTSMVRPSLARSRMTERTSPTISGSSAEVGSSKSSTSGSMARARAMATRCFWPPESCRGRALM